MNRRCLFVALSAILVTIAPHANAGGYAIERLGDGLEHFVSGGVHVAKLVRGAPYTLRSVVAAGKERTSSLCARLGCVVAVNGDFAGPAGSIGGTVSQAQPVDAPDPSHTQLLVGPDGRPAAGALTWRGVLMPTDLRPLDLVVVNAPPPAEGLALYTTDFGADAPPGAAAMIVRFADPARRLRLAETALVRLTEPGRAWTIPTDGALIVAYGNAAGALPELWAKVASGRSAPDALLRVDPSHDVVESIGGGPLLLREGKVVVPDADTTFVRGRHPRTAVGWDPAGTVLLVTVDGRQPGHSDGMTLHELAQLMASLGAHDALNLDGGGSTTFVKGGTVVNRPSDRVVVRGGRELLVPAASPSDRVLGNVERPVSGALAIVPRADAAPRRDDALQAAGIDLPRTVALPVPITVAPSADPLAAAVPVLLPVPPGPGVRPAAVLVLGLAVAVLWAANSREFPAAWRRTHALVVALARR